jgi:hypothetical protein
MRKLLTVAVLLLSVVAIPATSADVPSASAATLGWPGLICSANHWIRDVSNGNKLVGVNVHGPFQMEDDPQAGYPMNYVFVFCHNGSGQEFLQSQYPSSNIPGSHLWVSANVGAHYALTDTATGPGPNEAFFARCAGPGREYIHWAVNADDTFTIATTPPSLWTGPPSEGLPGTLYNISGVC